MSLKDKDEVIDLADQYVEWLLGESNTPPDILLAKVRSLKQRRRLWEQMDNINLIVAGALPRKNQRSNHDEGEDR